MSTPAHGALPKVVPLTARGEENGPGPGVRVFGACRDLLLDALVALMRELATAIAEELFALADATRDRDQQVRCLSLRTTVERDWERLVGEFRREALAQVARELDPEQSADHHRALAVPSLEGLTLLDDDDLAQNIVIRELAAMLSEVCAEELYTLERRIAALLGTDEPASRGNPLAPPMLCQALGEACRLIVADGETRLLLMRRLQGHLRTALPAIYQKANGYLIERGVLPDLKRTYRRENSGTRAPAAYAANVAAAPGGADWSASLPASGATGNEALAGAGPLSAPAPDDTRPTIGGDGATLARVQAILTGLQRQARLRSARQANELPAAVTSTQTLAAEARIAPLEIDPRLFATLDELQHAAPDTADGPLTNRVRALRESPSARAAGGLEAVTIDIIAMLFDFIFDDAQIPVAVKALVSRLQIPVLKVAMLDPGFFADRQHPARRFLGGISGVSIRWGEMVDENDPFFQKLAQLIETIQNEFEDDVAVFGTALAELEAFVASRQGEDEDTALTAANVVHLGEAQASAWRRSQQRVQAYCLEACPPEFVAAFLAEHWVAVLQAAALADDAAGWQNAERAMRELAWSVTPKKSSDERLALITRLPELLAQLKRGLVGINMRTEQSVAFFDALLPYHAAALKGDGTLLAAAATPPATSPAATGQAGAPGGTGSPGGEANGEGDLLITRSVDDGIEVEEIMLVGAAPVSRPDDQEIVRRVGELKRGDWVEFVAEDTDGTPGAAHRERVNWISPQRGILLFSNHQSAKAISITPDALARQIRDGRARLVAPHALFEQALNGALESTHVLG